MATHFIGVTEAQYTAAFVLYGTPDFVWPKATWSLLGSIDPGDTVVLGSAAFPTPKKWRGKVKVAHAGGLI